MYVKLPFLVESEKCEDISAILIVTLRDDEHTSNFVLWIFSPSTVASFFNNIFSLDKTFKDLLNIFFFLNYSTHFASLSPQLCKYFPFSISDITRSYMLRPNLIAIQGTKNTKRTKFS